MSRVNYFLAVAGVVSAFLWGEARANEIPAYAEGILLIRDTAAQSPEFSKKAVYYTSFVKMASGAPLYSINLTDGGRITVESWAMAKIFPFDGCFTMSILNDGDLAWIKEKKVLFEESAKKYPAGAKGLAEAAKRMEDAIKRYQAGEVREGTRWTTLAAIDERRVEAAKAAQKLKEAQDKEKAQRESDTRKREMEVMVAEAAQHGHVSEGIIKSLETLVWLRNTVLPRASVENLSLLRTLEYLRMTTAKMGAPSGLKFEMKASKVDILRRLDEATVSFNEPDISVDRVLDIITYQTQTRLLIRREQVLLVSREDRGAWPECETLQDWKEEATRFYPALADDTSELNKRVREVVLQKKQSDEAFFKKLDWPVRIAQAEAEKLSIAPAKTWHGPDFIVCGPSPPKQSPASPPKESAVASVAPSSTSPMQTGVGNLLSPGRSFRQSTPEEPKPIARLPLTHVQIARTASPSVGIIMTLDQNGEPVAMGSGFVVAKNVLITNHHVIEGKISGAAVRFPGIDKTFHVDRLIADHEKADLAALHISDLPVAPLTIHRGDLPEIGTDVYVLGSPEGLAFTFSNGMISGVRQNPYDSRLAWLQMTAPISHGSSGGPVLNESAEVIGVSVAGSETGQNLNFAIPAEYVLRLLGEK